MKFYGALESAALESLTTDPSVSVQGRIYYNSATSKFMLDDGTLKRALLRNDQNLVIGSDATAANNVRLNRAGAGYLQAVLASDTTAEGTLSTNLAQFGHRFPNFATNPAAGNAGRLIYNTTSSSLQLDLGASYLQLATLTGTETLTNKTLTAPALDVATVTDQSATPSTPASGITKVYTKSGQLYKLGSDGLETLVGSASGSGGFNYLTNGDFESGIATVQWAKTTVTNGLPSSAGPTITSSQGTSSLALSLETTAPLRNTKSLRITASSAWAQGDGVALGAAFTVQPEDRAKVLTIKMAYQVVSGALNLSGVLGSQNIALAIYDITAGGWVPAPAGAYGANSATLPGVVSATFQTSSVAGQQYQVFLFNLGATTSGAVTLLVDDCGVGPQTVVNGAAVTAWQTYTPIISATTTAPTRPTAYTENARWRRVGGDMEIEYFIAWASATGGAAGSGAYLIGLPVGLSIDTSLKPIGASQNICGNFRAIDSANVMIGGAHVYSATQIACYGKYTGAGTTSSITDVGWGTAFGFNDTNTTVVVSFTAKVPIAGWSSNVQMSSDTDTRVCAAQVVGVPTNALSTTAVNVNYPTVKSDTHAAYQTSGNYVVPVTGYYRVTASVAINGTFTTNQYGVAYLYRNGVAVYQNAQYAASASTTSLIPEVAGTVLCTSGDTLAIYAKSSGASLAYNSDVTFHYFNVERVSGPSAIAATETVAMRYTNVAGTSVASGATTVIPFTTKSFDTHSANGASTYTVPVSGKYRVTCTLYTAAMSLTTAQTINHSLYLNGAAYSLLQSLVGNGAASALYSPSGSDTIQCNANDQIAIYLFNGAGATISLNTGAGLNHLSVERIGN